MRNGPDATPVTRVGDYVVEAKLGEGGFGTVYRGVHSVSGKRVAIKVLSQTYSADPNVVSRFIAEARAVNQIRHQNIVDIFSFGELPDGRRYYVMEYLEGVTLEAHLRRRGALEIGEVIAILEPLARALDAAHETGIAHRDLKPANIILQRGDDGGPYPKLLDFGIAKLLSDELPRSHRTKSGIAVGTPDYMSPEQVEGTGVDHRTDIYSFGVITFRMLAGRLPFQAENNVEMMMKHLRAKPPQLRSLAPKLPEAVEQLVQQLLAKDREARPDRLLPWVQALRMAVATATTAPETDTNAFASTMRPMRVHTKHRIALGLCAAVLVALLAVSWYLRDPPAAPPRVPVSPPPVVAAPPPPPAIAPPDEPAEEVAAPKSIEKRVRRPRAQKKVARHEDELSEWDDE